MSDPEVTVYVRQGEPDSAAVIAYLEQRGIPHTVRDVAADPSASAVLFGRLGRVTTPVIQKGDQVMVGYDPLQLARFVPVPGGAEETVSFGAAVRGVSDQLARERGLPWRYGVEVGPVREGGAAAEAGIRPGDLITHIGAYTLDGGADQFRVAVAARRPGDTMSLTLRREGAELVVGVEFPRGTGVDRG